MKVKHHISVFFLLTALFSLLVHTVLPHHHHDNLICVMETHQCDEPCENYDADHEKTHQHDSGEIEDCTLKTLVLKNSESVIKFSNPVFICLYLLSDVECIFDSSIPDRPKHYLEYFQPPFVLRINGLRAPPFCC